MTTLKTKLTNALSTTVLVAATVVMAGLGFAVIGTLALFALVAVGVAMIAAPFARMTQPEPDIADAEVVA